MLCVKLPQLNLPAIGRSTGYFVSSVEFEEQERYKTMAGQSFATADLTQDDVKAIASGRMSSEHDHLNALWMTNSECRYPIRNSVWWFPTAICDGASTKRGNSKAVRIAPASSYLRLVPGSKGRYDYGYLPPRLFAAIVARFEMVWAAQQGHAVPRD